jgi:hypothetical protein
VVDLYAVDPGGTIGVANVAPGGRYESRLYKDVQELFEYIDGNMHGQLVHVVVEDFSGAGRLSGDAKRTMMMVGAVVAWCKWMDIPCTVHTEQRRLSGVTEARGIVDALLPDVPAKIRIHAIDAMAHAVVWRRHNEH